MEHTCKNCGGFTFFVPNSLKKKIGEYTYHLYCAGKVQPKESEVVQSPQQA